jgi:amino acid permease
MGSHFDVGLYPSYFVVILTLVLTSTRLLTPGLMDGGTAGLIWGFVVVTVGFFLVSASLAEMASMYAGVFVYSLRV